jgi:hypothetical protein
MIRRKCTPFDEFVKNDLSCSLTEDTYEQTYMARYDADPTYRDCSVRSFTGLRYLIRDLWSPPNDMEMLQTTKMRD